MVRFTEQRGVKLSDIAEVTLWLQEEYIPGLSIEECLVHVEKVLKKREVLNSVLTGIALDMLADQKMLPEPLQEIVEEDDSLYGVDEILVLGIVNVYGSIGFTNYGYVDKSKYGIIKYLDEQENQCNTFMDDIVGAVAAAAASRMAHRYRDKMEEK